MHLKPKPIFSHLGTALFLLFFPAVALGQSLPASGHKVAPNSTHDYCFQQWYDGDEYLADNAMTILGYTDMNASYSSSCDKNNSVPDTDVIFIDTNVPPFPLRGYSRCRLTSYPTICESWEVEIDKAQIDYDDGPYISNLIKTLCHEVGHTVGLPHYDIATPDGGQIGCMFSGWFTNTSLLFNNYSSYNRGRINAFY